MRIHEETGARVVGLDLTESMLHEGARRIERRNVRVPLVCGRAEELPFPDESFEALTFTYLLRYVADPAATLRELARVTKPGGRIASLEFFVPPNRFWRAAWHLYTRVVLPAAGALAGGRAWYDVGRFLGPNITSHYHRYPLEWTVRAWEEAGIASVSSRVMSLGGGLVMWGTRSGG
jgi:demethylmenaquinone methyltransferase/2-methoxy-6-polyprenyl-1,4-benzoquinol methylase